MAVKNSYHNIYIFSTVNMETY